MKEIKPHSSIETEQINKSNSSPISTISPFVEEYFNVHTMQKHPATERFIKQLAADLKLYADEPDTIRMSDFYDKHGIPEPTFFNWVSKFEELSASHEYAKRRLGAKREDGAISRRMDGSFIARTIGHYDKIYKDEQIFLEKLKAENVKPDVNLIIEPFKQTPEEVANKINAHTKTNHEGAHYKPRKKE